MSVADLVRRHTQTVFPNNEAFDGFNMVVGAGRGVRLLSTWESPLKPPPLLGRVCSLIVFSLESLLSPECCWYQFLGFWAHVIRFNVQRDVLSDVD